MVVVVVLVLGVDSQLDEQLVAAGTHRGRLSGYTGNALPINSKPVKNIRATEGRRAEDSFVSVRVVCVSGFNMCDGCQLVCVVVLHVIRHVTREKNQSLGTTRIHSFYIGDPCPTTTSFK